MFWRAIFLWICKSDWPASCLSSRCGKGHREELGNNQLPVVRTWPGSCMHYFSSPPTSPRATPSCKTGGNCRPVYPTYKEKSGCWGETVLQTVSISLWRPWPAGNKLRGQKIPLAKHVPSMNPTTLLWNSSGRVVIIIPILHRLLKVYYELRILVNGRAK